MRAGEVKLREHVRGVPPQRRGCEREEMRLLLLLLLLLLLVRLFAEFILCFTLLLSLISLLLATTRTPHVGFNSVFHLGIFAAIYVGFIFSYVLRTNS